MMDRFAVVAIVALVALMGSPCRGEKEMDDEPLETFTLDEPSARTFITVNGSNIITTPNFVVGVTLIGIALALLAGSAASAASVAAASSLAGGNFQGGPGKYKRSIPEDSIFDNLSSAANVLQAVNTLEQQFRNFDITDVECRKRIICEIHEEGAKSGAVKKLGQLSDMVLNVLNNVNIDPSDGKTNLMKPYLEAANHGKAQRECSQLYNTCEYSIKKVLRNIGF